MSALRSDESLSARARPPFKPPLLPSSDIGVLGAESALPSSCPLARSTTIFASWLASRGRLVDLGMSAFNAELLMSPDDSPYGPDESIALGAIRDL